MPQRPKAEEPPFESIQGEKLEPIGSVRRELTRPDGSRVVVEVPVYPPFRLAEGGSPRRPPRARSAPTLGRRRAATGSKPARKPE